MGKKLIHLGVTAWLAHGALHSAELIVLQSTEVDPAALNFSAAAANFSRNINGRTYQRSPMSTFRGYQYATYYDTNRNVCLARRKLPAGSWSVIRFTDYTINSSDSHNVVALGICAADGTIHLAFDHHADPLNYRVSAVGAASDPDAAVWSPTLFGPVTNKLGTLPALNSVTYPSFFNAPNGNLMLYYRFQGSGSGDGMIHEYDGITHDWTTGMGKFIARTGTYNGALSTNSTTRNPYINGISYGGNRLHASWGWRESSGGAQFNHDLNYAYSDDNGRTWNNTAGTQIGTTNSSFINIDSTGLLVASIPQNIGLSNQYTHYAYPDGSCHVIVQHNESGTTTSRYHHYWRSAAGTWSSQVLPFSGSRPKLVGDDTRELFLAYTSGGTLRIAKGTPNTAQTSWSWSTIHTQSGRSEGGEGQIDTTRWEAERILSAYGQVAPNSAGDPTALSIFDYQVSAKAILPTPLDEQSGVLRTSALTWTAGLNAVSHRVYFGTEATAVTNATTASPEYKGQQNSATYTPGILTGSTTYFWRIDEVDDSSNVHKGLLWSFTTEPEPPPVVSSIADQETPLNTATPPIPFTISDSANVVVTATSSNLQLLPESGILLGGSGINRTVTLTPATNQSGSADITLTATNAFGSGDTTFRLTVFRSLTSFASDAEVEITPGSPPTYTIRSVTAETLAIGTAGSNSADKDRCAVIPFQMPDFGPVANPFQSASFTANHASNSKNPVGNVMVYGLEKRSTDTVLMSDFWAATPTLDPSATLIQNTFIPSGSTAFGLRTTDATGSANLLAYLNAQYASGTGAGKFVFIRMAADAPQASGATRYNITSTEGAIAASTPAIQPRIHYTAVDENTPPTISDIADLSIPGGTDTAAIPFLVGDAQSTPSSLVVTGTSSNTTLVPESGIVFGGSGSNRTVTITPAAGESGSATITLTVDDGSFTASDTFVLTVIQGNNPPTISSIGDQLINQDQPTGEIPFSVGDLETPASALSVSAASSDTALIPVSSIVLGGSATDRTVSATPSAGMSGQATITLTVSDGSLTSTSSFLVAVNAPPTIGVIADASTDEDTPTSALPFTIGDPDHAAESLMLTATSGDATLVPVENIVFGGSGTDRTVTITPAADRSGTTTITVTVSDGMLSSQSGFFLTVNPTADSWVKASTGSLLSEDAAWSGGIVPSNPDTAIWDATSLIGPMTTGSDLDWTGLIVQDTTGPVTIDGPHTLTLGNLGIDLTNASSDLSLNHPVAMTGAQPWSVTTGRTLGVNGQLSGSGTLTKSGAGMLALRGNNSFAGNVTISSGPLRVAHSHALGTSNKTINASAGTAGLCQILLDGSADTIDLPASLTLNTSMQALTGAIVNEAGNNTIASRIRMVGGGGSTLVTVLGGSLALNGPISAEFSSGRSLVLDGSGNNSVNGVIADGQSTASVTVRGGTWNLSAASTYTGATTVQRGATLDLTGSLTSPVTVTGATLRGDGSVAADITLSSGTHAPGGSSSGIMSLAGNYALNPDATLQIDLNGPTAGTEHDQVRLTGPSGTVTLGGILQLNAPPSLVAGSVSTLIENTGPAPVSGEFLGMAEGSSFAAGGHTWTIHYTGGTGNDVTLTLATAQEAWRFAHFTTIENTGDAADSFDANQDGENNLLEFATGQNPLAATRVSTSMEPNGDKLEFLYSRSKAAITDGILFSVEWSDTLGTWNATGITEEILTDDGTVQSIKATLPAGTVGSRFVHLKVTR